MRNVLKGAALLTVLSGSLVSASPAFAQDYGYRDSGHYDHGYSYNGRGGYYHHKCGGGNGAVGTVVGGAGGALAGNALGGGLLGTVAGGVGGALIGRHFDKRHTRHENGC